MDQLSNISTETATINENSTNSLIDTENTLQDEVVGPVCNKDILLACKGWDAETKSNANCTISASLLMYNGGENGINEPLNYKQINSRFANQTEVEFIPHERFTQINFIFLSDQHPELKFLVKQLDQYTDYLTAMQDVSDLNESRPLIIYTVVPIKYFDRYYITFSNPLFWTKQPKDVGQEKYNMISLLVENDNFDINEMSDDLQTQVHEEADYAVRMPQY